MAKYRLEGDRLFLLENPQKLIISFYPLEALEPLVLGLFKNQEFSIGDRTGKTGFKVKSIEKLAEPEFKDCMEFSLLSPVHMARRNPFDNNQVDHLHPEHKDFELLLKQNLQSKYKAYHGVNMENKQEFRFELLSLPRSKVISIKKGEKNGSMLKSYLFDFRLTADKELIKGTKTRRCSKNPSVFLQKTRRCLTNPKVFEEPVGVFVLKNQ
jgi:CRISPR-associated endoribonuclease Cas6